MQTFLNDIVISRCLPICIFADIADTDIYLFFTDMRADIDIFFADMLGQKPVVIFDDFAEMHPNYKHPNKHSNPDPNTKFCIGYQNPQIWGNPLFPNISVVRYAAAAHGAIYIIDFTNIHLEI